MFNRTLASCIAEESQLLAEEKWIMNALKLIKNQRNALQIERLQLESMLAQRPPPKTVNLERPQNSQPIIEENTSNVKPMDDHEVNTLPISMDDASAFIDELDLRVGDNMNRYMGTPFVPSDEGEDSEEEIDINFFMNEPPDEDMISTN